MDETRDPSTDANAAVLAFTVQALQSRAVASTLRRGVDLLTSLLSARGGFLLRASRPGPATVLHSCGTDGPVRGGTIMIPPEVLSLAVRQGPMTVRPHRPSRHGTASGAPGDRQGGSPPGIDSPGTGSPAAGAGTSPTVLSVLITVEDVPWGRLAVRDVPGRTFTAADEQVATTIAAVLGAAVERDRLESAHAAIGALGFLIQRSRNAATAITAAVRAAAQVTGADAAAVIRFFPGSTRAVVVQTSRHLEPGIGHEYELDPRLAEALGTDEPVTVEDQATDARFTTPMLPAPFPSTAALAVPVLVDRRSWGRLVAGDRTPRGFTARQREAMWTVANMLSAALQRGPRRTGETRHRPDAGQVRGTAPETEVALVDREGTIVWVNEAWDGFCRANGGDPGRAGVGVSYLACCDDAGDLASREVAAAIRAAVEGDLPAPLRIVVPCHSPQEERWFDVLVSTWRDDRGTCLGAAVTLSPVR